MYSLLNRGIIPKDVDLSPAFERGSAPIQFRPAKIFIGPPPLPPQLSKPVSDPKARRQQAIEEQKRLNGSNAVPSVRNQIDTTFLTSLNAQGNIDEHINRINEAAAKAKRQNVPPPAEQHEADQEQPTPEPENLYAVVPHEDVSIM